MSKPAPQVVRLKTLDMRGNVGGLGHTSTPIRAQKKRVFTNDEWAYLQTLTDLELLNRIKQGEVLTKMLENYSWMNISRRMAKALTSNLHYQMDAIEGIIKGRNNNG